MKLREWEVWHTFSTFFNEPIKDLDKVARNLVLSGLFESAFLDDGKYFFHDGKNIISGKAEIRLEPERTSAIFELSEKLPDNFSGETILESIYFRFAEIRHFGENNNFPPKYIRGHLGECRLITEKYTYVIYPTVKLYENGVLLVELRNIHPNVDIVTEDFVDQFSNLYKIKFQNMLVPPSLHVNGQHAFSATDKSIWKIFLPAGTWLIDREIKKYLKEKTVQFNDGEFNFSYIPLWDMNSSEDDTSQPNYFSIDDLVGAIFQAVSLASAGLRTGYTLLFRGQNRPNSLSGYWSEHTNIHITKFIGQLNKAQQNESKFKDEFGWIMAGIYKKDKGLGVRYLPKNARHYGDYGVYVASNKTLWVWSKDGLNQQKEWEVPNRGHIIYFNQALCEMLDYGYALHQQIFRSVGNLDRSDDAINAKYNLGHLETVMRQPAVYGEISDLLESGWKDMGVQDIRKAISEILELKQIQASTQEQRQTFRWQTILTMTFGFLAIPEVASNFIKPLWNLSKLPRPQDIDSANLSDISIAFVFVCLLILIFLRITTKKDKRTK
jgi:hypothetical protein